MTLKTLSGIKVLDFSSYLAGPYGATLLGDLGADVIKVEMPGGDMMRKYPDSLVGDNRYHLGVNRNKRGIVLDLKTEEGQQAAQVLVRSADVVIHNFRPGVPERLGLGFEQLRLLNPRLVYCAITGYGGTGPLAQKPGFDQVLQCLSGIAAAQGAERGEPQVVLGSAVDFYTAALVAMSVSAALFDRERSGEAQLVECSLLRSALTMQTGRFVWAEGEGRDVERDLRPGRLSGIHPTAEGHLYVQAQSPEFWKALCELTGLAHLLSDPRCADMAQRKKHEAELLPVLRAALAQRTAAQWEQIFGDRVPCARVRRIEDLFDHPQVLEQGLVATHAHPVLGSYRAFSGPVMINGHQGTGPDRPAPRVGQHTEEVLREHGLETAVTERGQPAPAGG